MNDKPALTIYGDRISGNCLKVKWVAQRLRAPYVWVDVDVAKGEARSGEFAPHLPFGQVPAVTFEDGRRLAQSNAIIYALAERAASDLLPADPFDRAQMFSWMFWEQYSHEPAIAVRRFRKGILGQSDAELDSSLLEKGNQALSRMERALRTDWFVGAAVSLADVALVAYTRVADEGGFDLSRFPKVAAWVARVEREFAIPYTEGRL